MLNIKGIYIKKGCRYRKCLREETYYLLENKMPEDFFVRNLSITTIVGQNGAGKSSLSKGGGKDVLLYDSNKLLHAGLYFSGL